MSHVIAGFVYTGNWQMGRGLSYLPLDLLVN